MQIVTLTLFLVFFVSTTGRAETAEDIYLRTKTGYLQKFKSLKKASEKQDRAALSDLERQLKTFLVREDAVGKKQMTISLSTLFPDPDNEHLDGLLDNGNFRVLLTNLTLLSANFNLVKIDVNQMVVNDTLYRRAIGSDAAYTLTGEIPTKKPNGLSVARTLLVIEAQDIGPFVPTLLTAFAQRGEAILIGAESLQIPLKQLPACLKIWENHERVSAVLHSKYVNSGLKNTQAIDESHATQDAGFKKYVECFDRDVRKNSAYKNLKKQAQSMVDRLSAF